MLASKGAEAFDRVEETVTDGEAEVEASLKERVCFRKVEVVGRRLRRRMGDIVIWSVGS